jgi:hypothetical protein
MIFYTGAPVMEIAMRVRLIGIAMLLTAGTAAIAEPQKAPSQPAPQPKQIVLASADTVRSPGPAAPKPAKRPGRVTTCRCGDPQPAPETPDQ